MTEKVASNYLADIIANHLPDEKSADAFWRDFEAAGLHVGFGAPAPASRQVPMAVLEGQIERLRKNDFAGMETMRTFALNIIDDLLSHSAANTVPVYRCGDAGCMCAPGTSCDPAPTTSPEPDAVREALARIVDPHLFRSAEAQWISLSADPKDTDSHRNDNYRWHIRYQDALRKVDAIIAALSRPAHGGWEDIGTAPVEPWSEGQPSYYRFDCLLQNEKGWVKQGYGHYTSMKHKLVWKEQNGSAFDPIYWMPLPIPRHDRGSEAR